jgi:hypothetical protein
MFAVISPKELIFKNADTICNEQQETPVPQPPYNHYFEAYSRARVRALVAAKDFIKHKKPESDAYIMPAYVIRDNKMVTDPKRILESTSAAAFVIVLGQE